MMLRTLLLTVVLLFFIACQNDTKNSTNERLDNISLSFSVELQTSQTPVTVDNPIELIVSVKNDKGELAKDLLARYKRQLNLIVVSQDLEEFYHFRPDQQENGTFKAKIRFPKGGDYKIFVELKPKGAGNPTIQAFDLKVDGEQKPSEKLKPDEKLQKESDGLIVALRSEGKLIAGNPVVLRFRVVNATDKQPIREFDEYFGEKAHFVFINESLNEFVHTTAHEAGRSRIRHEHHEHSEKQEEKAEKLEEKSETKSEEDEAMLPVSERATFLTEVTFPKEGIYKFWVEFMYDGKPYMVPFVVKVESSFEVEGFSEVRVPDGAFKVLITEKGFRPNSISYRRGKPLTLAFVRLGNENCGKEIVFDKLNIRLKEIPIGEAVTVEIPTENEGVFTFVCGSHRGTISIEK